MTAFLISSRLSSDGLHGKLPVPGDKSISHRMLILSSQVLGNTRISGLLEGEDVLRTANALRMLGVTIEKHGDEWEVSGVGIGGLKECKDVLDMGNSGTSARLLMGLLTPYPYTSFFTGDESLRARPMARVILPLTAMGARIVAASGEKLPIALAGTATPSAIEYTLPVPSAQVKSAILLAALHTPGKTTVIEPVPSRNHTENMMKNIGIKLNIDVINNQNYISLEGNQPQIAADRVLTVPGDPSSAGFIAVAAAICPGSDVTILNVCMNDLRCGLFLSLKEMGAIIDVLNKKESCGEPIADIRIRYSKLTAIDVPSARAPSMIDEYPILAVAAAFAEGETAMHGLSELRVKESNRLDAIINMLIKSGVNIKSEGDSLYISGAKSVHGGATINAKHDHRMAMSALVMGMATESPMTVEGVESIATSFPGFVDLINGLGGKITGLLDEKMTKKKDEFPHPIISSSHHPLIIAIDGPAGSGKGTLARRLAEQFDLEYLDTGSLYRAVGLKLIYSDKDPSDKEAALEAARAIDAGDLANPRLRQERIGQAASIISAYPEVRAALLDFQRNFAKGKKGAVLDGRDIGTVVCPDARFKFFITATLYARAKRRHKELEGEGIEVVFESVLADLRERDERDERRAVAPLKPAEDAIIMDTSDMDASEVFERARQAILMQKNP